jgi:hypothetical protein
LYHAMIDDCKKKRQYVKRTFDRCKLLTAK